MGVGTFVDLVEGDPVAALVDAGFEINCFEPFELAVAPLRETLHALLRLKQFLLVRLRLHFDAFG